MIMDVLCSNQNFFLPKWLQCTVVFNLTPESCLLFLLNKLTLKYRIHTCFNIKLTHQLALIRNLLLSFCSQISWNLSLQSHNYGLQYWISFIIILKLFFNVNITQSKAERLKCWFLYTNLNYQMISMEKFPDKFLNIW